MRIHELYLNKVTRDIRAKELKAQGHDVYRSVCKGQLLHPQYVEDFAGPEKLDTGFGNTVYKTYFSTLYAINSR